MIAETIRVIPERRLKRLGRHIQHDSRSRSFETVHASGTPLVSAKWERHCDPFDQGDVGSCTCEAMVGALMTGPFYDPSRILTQSDCVDLYMQATRLDGIPGHYPPDDTGSSGLAAAKAAHRRGWLRAYHHAFSFHAVLASLGQGPGIIGINWYESFDSPVGPGAELQIGGQVRGGHEMCVTEVDHSTYTVRGVNSWGTSWGDSGYWTMTFDTLAQLMSEQGDYIVPVL